ASGAPISERRQVGQVERGGLVGGARAGGEMLSDQENALAEAEPVLTASQAHLAASAAGRASAAPGGGVPSPPRGPRRRGTRSGSAPSRRARDAPHPGCSRQLRDRATRRPPWD